MTLFYIGPRACITHEVFQVRWPSYRSFAIRELTNVHVVRDWTDPVTVGAHQIRVASTWLAGTAAVATALGWSVLHSPTVSILAFMILAVSLVVSGVCWRVRTVPYVLQATYRGELVRLCSIPDARTFGQVKRALVRALEQVPVG
ncbi:MAG TPA: DUF6232 family protein [Micromonosporaceae bacterium]|nr:DUF6232 family protein [Micromonosporaceae bacterium]